MNLYDLHPNPEKAPYYDRRFEIPSIAYEEATEIFRKTGKRVCELEHVIAKDALWSYRYALFGINQKFLEGELVIKENHYLTHCYNLYFTNPSTLSFADYDKIIKQAQWCY